MFLMPNTAENLSGRKINHLLVVNRNSRGPKPFWNCLCDCGKTAVISAAALRGGQNGCGFRCEFNLSVERIDGWSICDKNAPKYIKSAYKSWCDQRQRCTNPNDPRYEWWGKRGIKVEYSAFEFVQWWVGQWGKDGPFKRPNCSRKDHDKNYSLDNIVLMECSENAKERIERCGAPAIGCKRNAKGWAIPRSE